jgi:hypothetical protein
MENSIGVVELNFGKISFIFISYTVASVVIKKECGPVGWIKRSGSTTNLCGRWIRCA